MPDSRAEREADLRTYYDNEAADRRDKHLPVARVQHRDAFIELLRRERRGSVVEVGTGPGRDLLAFRDAGLAVRGLDLAPASVELCRAEGLDVQVGSVLETPFGTGEFESAYTASTLLHVADADLDTALAELVRVTRPGSRSRSASGAPTRPASNAGARRHRARPGSSRCAATPTCGPRWSATPRSKASRPGRTTRRTCTTSGRPARAAYV